MSCFTGMFKHRKKRKEDVELDTINKFHNSDSDDERPPPLYAPNKDLFASSAPPEILILSSTPIVSDDLQFLATEKTFVDYFIPAESRYLPSSELVRSQQTNFEKLLRLESEEDWEIKFSKPFARIYTKVVDDNEPPIVKALFNMQVNAIPEDLYELLYNVEVRKEWDKGSVIEFVEIGRMENDATEYYMVNKAPWPFNNRDFVEMRYTRRMENGDIEVVYMESERKDYPAGGEGVERGKTVFGGQVFRKVRNEMGETLIVTIVSQGEMGGKVPPKMLKETLSLSLVNWYKSVRKELLKKNDESNVLL